MKEMKDFFRLEEFCEKKNISLTSQELRDLDETLRVSRNEVAHKVQKKEFYSGFLEVVSIPPEQGALLKKLISTSLDTH